MFGEIKLYESAASATPVCNTDKDPLGIC